jgi:hypothetical protein
MHEAVETRRKAITILVHDAKTAVHVLVIFVLPHHGVRWNPSQVFPAQ